MLHRKPYQKCKVVAEIGATHIGSVDRAKKLIDLAVICGSDYVKFQKRNPEESVPENIKNKPHPNLKFSYGNTYLEHRKNLELNIQQHIELKKYCDLRNIGYAVSCWDITSAKEIIENINIDYIKIPSACNSNFELLEYLEREFSGDIHLSLGMVDPVEKGDIIDKIDKLGLFSRIVLYHCTSEYPCPFEKLFLLEIEKLKDYTCKEIGFSNHGYGIACDIVAYVFGATWIERHFIDDRTFRHTDAVASLEPDGLRKLCRDLKAIQKALNYKDDITQEEMIQRQKLRVK